jgi:hypothetical protein
VGGEERDSRRRGVEREHEEARVRAQQRKDRVANPTPDLD